MVRSRISLHLEIIALRHQLTVVNRSRRPRFRLTSVDRMLSAWFSRSWRGWRSAIHIVKPETVLAWHRRGFRLFWTWKSRHRTGRPAVPHDVRALIREMSTANPLWGAPRIHGELQKLRITVSESTVAKYMRRHPRPRHKRGAPFSPITPPDLRPGQAICSGPSRGSSGHPRVHRSADGSGCTKGVGSSPRVVLRKNSRSDAFKPVIVV
jgi:hypothetical protein